MEATTNQVTSSSATLDNAQFTATFEEQQQEQQEILAALETVIQEVAQEVAAAKSGDGALAATVIDKVSHGKVGQEPVDLQQNTAFAQIVSPIAQIQEANCRFLETARS